jgi:hypothetical protein
MSPNTISFVWLDYHSPVSPQADCVGDFPSPINPWPVNRCKTVSPGGHKPVRVPSIPGRIKHSAFRKSVNRERRAAFPLRLKPEFPRRHSMIRLRKTDKTSFEIDQKQIPFIELTDLNGDIGLLIMQPEPGTIIMVEPNTEDAARYEALMKSQGVKFAQMLIKRK